MRFSISGSSSIDPHLGLSSTISQGFNNIHYFKYLTQDKLFCQPIRLQFAFTLFPPGLLL